MISNVQYTHESLLLFKRDIAVVTNYHMTKLLGVKKNIGEKSSSTPSEVSESQAFFSDAEVQSYIDNIVANFLAMNKLASEMPSFEILTPEPETTSTKEGKAAASSSGGVSGVDDFEPFSKISEEVGYVSEFMIHSSRHLNNLKQLEKEIVDYCFYNEENKKSA